MLSWSPILSLGNSILGVSLLAMPYCMKQCGILLGSLLLLCSAFLSRLACCLLLQSAHSSRLASYEQLALKTFSASGKFAVELCVSSLLIFGGCVAYLIVVGDTAPIILSDVFGLEPNWNLRMTTTLLLAVFVAFPLSLMRDSHNLIGCSTVAFFFYVAFSIMALFLSVPNLTSGKWAAEVNLWKTAGLFKCLPIFSIAFPCQAQLFHLLYSLPDPSTKNMNLVVSYATTLVAGVYLLVGIFGYVAFLNDVSGDVLTSFSDSMFAFVVRIGFAASALLSFPLMVFPARASIYSVFLPNATGDIYIPQSRLVLITGGIIVFTLVIAVFLPNVELILGLTGATAGTIICYIFPGLIFLKTSDDKKLRSWAKLLTAVGFLCLVCSTFAVLSETEMSASGMHDGVPLPKPAETIKSDPKDQENPVASDVPRPNNKDAGNSKNNEEEKEEEPNNKQALTDNEANDDGRPKKEAPLTERKRDEVKALIDAADQKEKNDRAQEEKEKGVEEVEEEKEGGQRREPLVPQAPDPNEEEKVKRAEKEEKKEEEGKRKEEDKEKTVQDEGNKSQIGKSRALKLSEPQPKNSDKNHPEDSKKKGDNESKVGRTEEGNTKEEAKANQEALPKANQANATPRNEEKKKESPLGTVRRQTTPQKTASKRRNSIAERLGLNALHRHVGRPR